MAETITKVRVIPASGIPSTVDLSATGNFLKADNFQIGAAGVTASKPLKVDADKKFTSGDIGLTSEVTGVLPVANGGTNSSTALNNNRVMKSSGGATVEAAAITANRALASDANGIPVATAVTDTELGYLDGVTSAVQTQLNALSTGYSRRTAVRAIVADNTAEPGGAGYETNGYRYILSVDGGEPHANYDGASAGDIVEFVTDTWVAVTPVEGYVAYSDADNKDALYVDDTPAWELRPVSVTDHVDLANKGDNTHSQIDTHLGDGTKHFTLLDQDAMDDNDDSKAPSQQSVKAYVDALTHDGLTGFVGNEHLPAVDQDGMDDDSAVKVPTQQSVKAYVDALTHDGLTGFVSNEHLPGIDEDDMSSDSNAHVPTQQSVKAYVDNYAAAAVSFTNNTGGQLDANTVVALSITVAGEIIAGDASGIATCEGIVGVVKANIADEASGLVQIAGEVTPSKTANFDLGKRVYVSETTGEATKTAPTTASSVIYLLGIASALDKVILQPQLVEINAAA